MILRKKRDFGERINAIFEFINLNQRDFYRAVVLVICPLAIVGGVLAGMISGSLEDIVNNPGDPTVMLKIFGSFPFWGAMVSSILGYNIVLTVSNVFIKLYLNKVENLSVETIWKEMKKYILPVFGVQFLSAIFLFIAYFLSILLMVMLGQIHMAFIIIGAFGVLLLLGYLATNFFLVYAIVVIEEHGVFGSFARAFWLMRNHFWSTFGYFFVIFLIYMAISFIFTAPAIIVEQIAALHVLESESAVFTMTKIAANIFSSVGSYLLLPVLILAPTFQYFNLVEHKESTGLLERIEQFGIREEKREDEEIY
ncbi:MAG: hypothetical protein ACPGJS_18640 [Flammeovirgaceae bacterium]